MRVIAGRYKGRKLSAPQGKEIRPTTDKTKEAIFSILTNDIPGARVLDVFSGTGALGIEALSRGADLCVFCDNSKPALSQIRANLDHCGIETRSLQRAFAQIEKGLKRKDADRADDDDEDMHSVDDADPAAVVCPGDMEKTLEHIARISPLPFHVILMDPPYGQGLCRKAMETVSKEGLLTDDGVIVCEHTADEEMPETSGGFVKIKERKYGISRVSIYVYRKEPKEKVSGDEERTSTGDNETSELGIGAQQLIGWPERAVIY